MRRPSRPAHTESRPAIGSDAGARAGSNGSTRPRESTSARRSVRDTSATGVASRTVTVSVPGSRRSTDAASTPGIAAAARRTGSSRSKVLASRRRPRRRTTSDSSRYRVPTTSTWRIRKNARRRARIGNRDHGADEHHGVAMPPTAPRVHFHRAAEQRADGGTDLRHVACAESEEDVAVAQQVRDRRGERRAIGMVFHGAPAPTAASATSLPVTPGSGCSRAPYTSATTTTSAAASATTHRHAVLARARVEVRLEHRDQPAIGKGLSRRGQRGRELGGVMGIVIDNGDAGHIAQPLESPADAAERRQRFERSIDVGVQRDDNPECGRRIAKIVHAGHLELQPDDLAIRECDVGRRTIRSQLARRTVEIGRARCRSARLGVTRRRATRSEPASAVPISARAARPANSTKADSSAATDP